jgi:hypothetical protein
MGMVEALHRVCLVDEAAHLVNHGQALRGVAGQVGVVWTRIFRIILCQKTWEGLTQYGSMTAPSKTEEALHTCD